jgi:hypothetical protein
MMCEPAQGSWVMRCITPRRELRDSMGLVGCLLPCRMVLDSFTARTLNRSATVFEAQYAAC